MTREEAIQILRTRIVPTKNWNEISTAVDMAIEALQESEINCVHCPHYHEREDDTGVYGHCEGGDSE